MEVVNIEGEIYDPKTKAKLRRYKIWRKFGTPPSEQRKERNVDIDECLKIDMIVEEAIKREHRRQQAVEEAKARSM